jgi:hypothetical protein
MYAALLTRVVKGDMGATLGTVDPTLRYVAAFNQDDETHYSLFLVAQLDTKMWLHHHGLAEYSNSAPDVVCTDARQALMDELIAVMEDAAGEINDSQLGAVGATYTFDCIVAPSDLQLRFAGLEHVRTPLQIDTLRSMTTLAEAEMEANTGWDAPELRAGQSASVGLLDYITGNTGENVPLVPVIQFVPDDFRAYVNGNERIMILLNGYITWIRNYNIIVGETNTLFNELRRVKADKDSLKVWIDNQARIVELTGDIVKWTALIVERIKALQSALPRKKELSPLRNNLDKALDVVRENEKHVIVSQRTFVVEFNKPTLHPIIEAAIKDHNNSIDKAVKEVASEKRAKVNDINVIFQNYLKEYHIPASNAGALRKAVGLES